MIKLILTTAIAASLSACMGGETYEEWLQKPENAHHLANVQNGANWCRANPNACAKAKANRPAPVVVQPAYVPSSYRPATYGPKPGERIECTSHHDTWANTTRTTCN